MKKYLITPTLLNSWKYCVESDYGSLEDFIKTLNKEKITDEKKLKAFKKGNEFEEYMIENYPDTMKGCYQVKVSKEIIVGGNRYLLYGKVDCLKAGVITDYKFTGVYDVGKFYGSYQTAVYLELVPEAYKMQYLISNNWQEDKVENNWEKDKYKFDLYFEDYYKKDLKVDLEQEIISFINWLDKYDLLKLFEEKWKSKY